MLKLENVSIGHPHRPLAVREATMSIGPSEFVGVLGTNGSGKSELVQGIAGLIPIQQGTVTLDGRAVRSTRTFGRERERVALVPEGRHVFTDLTVRENLELVVSRRRRDLIPTMLERFPILQERSRALAGTLSGGEQQQLAIARSLLMEPSVLLLDEPSAGLSPLMVKAVYDLLDQVRKTMAIVVVEQVASLLLSRVDRLHVMSGGRIVHGVRPEELADPLVLRRLYFGDLSTVKADASPGRVGS